MQVESGVTLAKGYLPMPICMVTHAQQISMLSILCFAAYPIYTCSSNSGLLQYVESKRVGDRDRASTITACRFKNLQQLVNVVRFYWPYCCLCVRDTPLFEPELLLFWAFLIIPTS